MKKQPVRYIVRLIKRGRKEKFVILDQARSREVNLIWTDRKQAYDYCRKLNDRGSWRLA